MVDLREKTLAQGLEEHGLDEVDLAIDTSGKGAARQSYLNVLLKRGVLVCAGHGEGLSLDVSRDLIAPERAVLGSEYFCYDEVRSNLEMLDRERPDLVSVCLPNLGHFGPTLQVIEAGFPLLVEKPLVFDLGEAETLLNEASRRVLSSSATQPQRSLTQGRPVNLHASSCLLGPRMVSDGDLESRQVRLELSR